MSDYSGELVEIEVGRYGLRTFQHVTAAEAAAPREQAYWSQTFRVMYQTLGLESEKPAPDEPMELCSTAIHGSFWKDGVCEATCQKGDNPSERVLIELAALTEGVKPVYRHSAPQENCGCGIYATHTLSWLKQQFSSYVKDIVAVIAAEGQTIIGDKGFRTERARVVAYWCSDLIAPTAASQFADAKRYSDVESMLNDYGLEVGETYPKPSWASAYIKLAPSTYTLNVPAINWPPPPPPVIWSAVSKGEGDSSEQAPPKRGNRAKAVGVSANTAAAALNSGLFLSSHNWWCFAWAIVSLIAAFYFLVVAK